MTAILSLLYHFTCDHAAPLIREAGVLRPGVDGLLWLTDLDVPVRQGLGLTMQLTTCDRTRHRFEVRHPQLVYRWVAVRRDFDGAYVESLESAPGAMPMHWWVTAREQEAVES